MKKLICIIGVFFLAMVSFGQGLEDIIVETYYISDSNDASDTDGGFLPEGSVTYRIFVDMLPGYEIQAVYGNSNHTAFIQTSTEFFNNEDRGEQTGDAIGLNRWDDNTVAVDSYVTLGAATSSTLAVLKTEDSNGAVPNSDGFILSENPLAGIPVSIADGMIPGTLPSGVVTVGLDLSMFADVNDASPFSTNGGAWSVLEGVVGPTPENRVLIAQITTDGELSFELNVQLGTPNGEVEQYVARDPIGSEFLFPALIFPSISIEGCTSATACNFNPAANIDNGTCLEPVENCTGCELGELVIIDSDWDGICDADEVLGCTSDTACNFNPNATDEDGTCIEATPGCTICNSENDGLELVDADGDGICDADEVPGCSSEVTACNYNPNATDEVPCIVPIPNCAECNALNDALILIDSDGDGICDADDTDCQGDYNNDLTVNSGDLLVLLADFGCVLNCSADLSNDDAVNSADLVIFLSIFGSSCL